LPCLVVPCRRDAAAACAEAVLADFAERLPDLGGAVILLPEALHHIKPQFAELQDRLLQGARERGHDALIAPLVSTPRQLFMQRHARARRMPKPHELKLLLAGALEQHPGLFPPGSVWQLAGELLRFFDEVSELDDARKAGGKLLEDHLARLDRQVWSAETEMLLTLWRAWRELFGDGDGDGGGGGDDFADAGAAYRAELLRGGLLHEGEHAYLCGHDRLTPCQTVWARKLHDEGRLTLVVNADLPGDKAHGEASAGPGGEADGGLNAELTDKGTPRYPAPAVAMLKEVTGDTPTARSDDSDSANAGNNANANAGARNVAGDTPPARSDDNDSDSGTNANVSAAANAGDSDVGANADANNKDAGNLSAVLDQIFCTNDAPLAERARAISRRFPASPVAPRLRIFRPRTLEDHAWGVYLAVREWLAEDKSVGIVSLDRRLTRRLRAVFERHRLSLYDASGWELSTTSSAGALHILLQAADAGCAAREILALMRSPWCDHSAVCDDAPAAAWRIEDAMAKWERPPRTTNDWLERLREQRGGADDAAAARHIADITAGLRELAAPGKRERTRGRDRTTPRERERTRDRDRTAHGKHEHTKGRERTAPGEREHAERPFTEYDERLAAAMDALGMTQTFRADAAGERLLQELQQTREAAAAQTARGPFRAWRNWLAHNLESANFIPPAPDSGIALMNLRQSRLARFDALAVVSLDKQHLPAPPRPGLVDEKIRRELGLETREQREAFQFHLFRRLLESTGAVLLSCQQNAGDRALEASPWLSAINDFHRLAYGAGLEDEALARHARRAPQTALSAHAANDAHGENSAHGANSANAALDADAAHPAHAANAAHGANTATDENDTPGCGLAVQLQTRPAPPAPPDAWPKALSASAHKTLMECPYRFFVRYGLRIRERRDSGDYWQPAEYGTQLHRCLQALNTGLPGLPGPLNKAWTNAHLEDALALARAIVEEVFAEAAGANRANRHLRAEALDAVEYYVRWMIRRFAAEPTPALATEHAQQKTLDGGPAIGGKLDMVAAAPSGRQVVDFKSGKLPGPGEIDKGEDVQLSHYALLEEDAHSVLYLGLGRDKKHLERSGKKLGQCRDNARERLLSMHRDFINGAPLPAWGEEKTACKHCACEGLCRRPAWKAYQSDAPPMQKEQRPQTPRRASGQ